eukprot:Rmarinus@m.13595
MEVPVFFEVDLDETPVFDYAYLSKKKCEPTTGSIVQHQGDELPDDYYDTDDSFIDDTDLRFDDAGGESDGDSVEGLNLRHSGYYVNTGPSLMSDLEGADVVQIRKRVRGLVSAVHICSLRQLVKEFTEPLSYDVIRNSQPLCDAVLKVTEDIERRCSTKREINRNISEVIRACQDFECLPKSIKLKTLQKLFSSIKESRKNDIAVEKALSDLEAYVDEHITIAPASNHHQSGEGRSEQGAEVPQKIFSWDTVGTSLLLSLVNAHGEYAKTQPCASCRSPSKLDDVLKSLSERFSGVRGLSFLRLRKRIKKITEGSSKRVLSITKRGAQADPSLEKISDAEGPATTAPEEKPGGSKRKADFPAEGHPAKLPRTSSASIPCGGDKTDGNAIVGLPSNSRDSPSITELAVADSERLEKAVSNSILSRSNETPGAEPQKGKTDKLGERVVKIHDKSKTIDKIQRDKKRKKEKKEKRDKEVKRVKKSVSNVLKVARDMKSSNSGSSTDVETVGSVMAGGGGGGVTVTTAVEAKKDHDSGEKLGPGSSRPKPRIKEKRNKVEKEKQASKPENTHRAHDQLPGEPTAALESRGSNNVPVSSDSLGQTSQDTAFATSCPDQSNPSLPHSSQAGASTARGTEKERRRRKPWTASEVDLLLKIGGPKAQWAALLQEHKDHFAEGRTNRDLSRKYHRLASSAPGQSKPPSVPTPTLPEKDSVGQGQGGQDASTEVIDLISP